MKVYKVAFFGCGHVIIANRSSPIDPYPHLSPILNNMEEPSKHGRHMEFRTLVTVLQLVLTIIYGSPRLKSESQSTSESGSGVTGAVDIRHQRELKFTSKSALILQIVLDSLSNLLVRRFDVVAVTSTTSIAGSTSPAGSLSNDQVPDSLFPAEDAIYPTTDFTSIPLTNFAVFNNPDNDIHRDGFSDGMDVLVINGVSSLSAILKDSWYGLSMG
jgi:hypothetical protein